MAPTEGEKERDSGIHISIIDLAQRIASGNDNHPIHFAEPNGAVTSQMARSSPHLTCGYPSAIKPLANRSCQIPKVACLRTATD